MIPTIVPIQWTNFTYKLNTVFPWQQTLEQRTLNLLFPTSVKTMRGRHQEKLGLVIE